MWWAAACSACGAAAGLAADRCGAGAEAYLTDGWRALARPVQSRRDYRFGLVTAGAGSFGGVGWALGVSGQAASCLAVVALLLLCMATDLYHRVIPYEWVWAATWCGLVASVLGCGGVGSADAIAGAAVGWGILRAVQALGRLQGGPGVGEGDLHVLAAGGAWGGPVIACTGLILAATAAALIASITVLRSELHADERAFAPHLFTGIVVSIIVGKFELNNVVWSLVASTAAK